VHLLALSTIWETPPVGGYGPNFLNAVALVRTDLSLDDLRIHVLQRIEAELGRIRTEDRYAPRPIDLDILIYDGSVIESSIWVQAFLAVPLAEITPTLTNSKSGETIVQIANRFRKETTIRPRLDIIVSPNQVGDWREVS
jgi:2-amino-4-hydroxy-6-hydroxymethyldihydropteridine diphosphokinase